VRIRSPEGLKSSRRSNSFLNPAACSLRSSWTNAKSLAGSQCVIFADPFPRASGGGGTPTEADDAFRSEIRLRNSSDSDFHGTVSEPPSAGSASFAAFSSFIRSNRRRSSSDKDISAGGG